MALILWEWIGEGSLERSIELDQVLSPNDIDWGGGVVYEEFEPIELLQFATRGHTWTSVQAVITALKVRKSLYTVTDKHGRSWTGYGRKLGWREISGTSLWEMTLEMLLPPTPPEA